MNIPAYTRAVFEVNGSWNDVQEAWERIYTESSEHEHAGGPEMLANEENKHEIWVPIVKDRPSE